MLIDCTTCVAREFACGDCVVTVLLAAPLLVREPPPDVDLDDAEQAALGTLARAGLVPPLRLVRPMSPGGGLPETA